MPDRLASAADIALLLELSRALGCVRAEPRTPADIPFAEVAEAAAHSQGDRLAALARRLGEHERQWWEDTHPYGLPTAPALVPGVLCMMGPAELPAVGYTAVNRHMPPRPTPERCTARHPRHDVQCEYDAGHAGEHAAPKSWADIGPGGYLPGPRYVRWP